MDVNMSDSVEQHLVSVLDKMRSKEVYDRYRMAERAEGVKCEAVEWVQRNKLNM